MNTIYHMNRKCERECEQGTQENIFIEPPSVNPKRENIFSTQIAAAPNPVPYTFRVAIPNFRRGIGSHPVRAPPFYLQLDHTLAVLWCLFRRKAQKAEEGECELGVSQLQWALYFLKGIKPPNGADRAQDIIIAIQAVEDALLELYASMCNIVMQTPEQEVAGGIPPISYAKSNITPPCSMCEIERAKKIPSSWIPDAANTICSKCSSTTLALHRGEGRPRKTENVESITSSKAIFVQSPLSSGIIEWEEHARTPFRGAPNIVIPKMCKKNAALSEEIFQLKKAAIELAQRLQQPSEDENEEGNIKQNQKQLKVMLEWRKEQVCRVQSELRRLRSLDSILGVTSNITEVSISSYTNQNASLNQSRSKVSFNPEIHSTPK